MGALKMQEWKKHGVDRIGGKCSSGKYGRENVWKTVRTENKIRIN